MLGTQRGLCPGSLGVSATLTLFGPSSLEGSDCWDRSLDSRGPTFQTESTSLEPGPCKTNKILGTVLPAISYPLLSLRCFLSPTPLLVLR